MFFFLFLLLAGLVLIYVNVSPVLPGKKGKLFEKVAPKNEHTSENANYYMIPVTDTPN